MPTQEKGLPKQPETQEARECMERVKRLRAGRAALAARAELDSSAAVELAQLDVMVEQLTRQAKSVWTEELLERVQLANRQQAEAAARESERAGVAALLRDELLRQRAEEYARFAQRDWRTASVSTPPAEVARRATTAEDLIAQMRVGGGDIHRGQWLRSVPGVGTLVERTYDEACEEFVGVKARFVRDPGLDRELRIHLTEGGEIAPGPAPEQEVRSPSEAESPPVDWGPPGPSVPRIES